MIQVFDVKDNCCGCTACKHICPTNAIAMKADEEGFPYPFINQELCIDCGLCKKVCVFQNGYKTAENIEIPEVYAVKHLDENVRLSSTSGGIFSALSDLVIENKGIIYGVEFDENMNVVHSSATSKENRDRFKGSKYVQSDLKDSFYDIGKLIKENTTVLFTGTPCQIGGLKEYIKLSNINDDSLITCDIVCHGTPSPLIWKEHINYLEKKESNKIINYYCRSKIRGWHGHNEMVVFENGKSDYKSVSSQIFKKLFHSHNILRPSCHNCKYTNLSRASDITIADFWGIERSMPDFDDNKGVSLVIVNTKKGKNYFDRIKDSLIYRVSNIEECLQPQLQYPTKPSPNRDEFWGEYKKYGYNYITKKYAGNNIKGYIRNIIKNSLIRANVLKK